MIFHRKPEVLEGLDKANHHERRFVIRELVIEGWVVGSADEQDYTLEYWQVSFAHLLAQTDPRTCIEWEEHERIGSEECFPFVHEAVRVELFRCLYGRRGKWMEQINVSCDNKKHIRV